MPNIYVRHSAGGAATGANWANAYLTLTAALAAATNADTIWLASDHSESTAAAVTLNCPSTQGLRILSSNTTTTEPPTGLSTTAVVAVGAASAALNIRGFAFVYGVQFLGGTNNSASCTMQIADASTSHGLTFDTCVFQMRTANASPVIGVGQLSQSNNDDVSVSFKDCTYKFGATGQSIALRQGRIYFANMALDAAGSTPTSLFSFAGGTAATATVEASDLSTLTLTNLLNWQAAAPSSLLVRACKIPSGVTPATGTNPSAGGPELTIIDCASGDTHGLYGYYNACGSLVSDTGLYFTSGAAGQSWKIVTTANCNYYTPFQTPWFGYYNSTLSAITPYVEILRDGSTTAYQDDEVWLDVMAKTNSGSTQSALTTDRMALLGTPANQDAGAGLGSWTGESGTAWSGKLAVASLTPAEVGYLSARIVVGEPSITVYADPQIRV